MGASTSQENWAILSENERDPRSPSKDYNRTPVRAVKVDNFIWFWILEFVVIPGCGQEGTLFSVPPTT